MSLRNWLKVIRSRRDSRALGLTLDVSRSEDTTRAVEVAVYRFGGIDVGLRSIGFRAMDRIAILGCGGSGKTFVANWLAALLDLPLTHLDAEFYDGDWNTLAQDKFEQSQRRLVGPPRWVLEGNYASTMSIRLAAADTVIFLDLPAVTCVAGILQRRLRYRGGQHINDGVYDRVTWSFVRYIWGYRKSMRPKVRRLIAEHGDHARLITLSSRSQTQQFLEALSAEHCTRRRPGAPAGIWAAIPGAGGSVRRRREFFRVPCNR